MPINKEINEILKKMWAIQEKEAVSLEEILYFNAHLHIIKEYYSKNNELWAKTESFSTEIINLML